MLNPPTKDELNKLFSQSIKDISDLHTLKAKIDYAYERAETIYGVIGIKVWLFSE